MSGTKLQFPLDNIDLKFCVQCSHLTNTAQIGEVHLLVDANLLYDFELSKELFILPAETLEPGDITVQARVLEWGSITFPYTSVDFSFSSTQD